MPDGNAWNEANILDMYPSSFQLKALYIHFNIIRIKSKLYLNFNRPHHDKNIFILNNIVC